MEKGKFGNLKIRRGFTRVFSHFQVFHIFVFTIFFLSFDRQTPDPVKWTFSAKKISADTFEIHLRAAIAKGWRVYSLFNNGGPGPSSVDFEKHKGAKMINDTKEIGKLQVKFEKLFQSNVRGYSSSVDFVQTFARKNSGEINITGKVKYITCNGTLCLPPKEVPFSVTVP